MNRAPTTTATDAALERAAGIAREFVAGLPDRPVPPTVPLDELRRRFAGPLPEAGQDAVDVVEELAANVEGGLVASAGPRYFGFVIGGGLPAALAADWLTSAWDQNAGAVRDRPGRRRRRGDRRRVARGAVRPARRTSASGSRPARRWRTSPGSPPRGTRLLARGLGRRAPGPVRGARRSRSSWATSAHVTIFAALQMLGLGRERVDPRRRRRPGTDAGRRLREALADDRRTDASCAPRPAT